MSRGLLHLSGLLTSLVTCLSLGCAPPPGGAQPASPLRGSTLAAIASAPAPAPQAVALRDETPAAAPRPSSPERVELERTLLASGSPGQRRDAVDKLAALPDAEDSLIRTVLSDGDPLVRRWAALALERRPASREVAAGLRQALTGERDRAVRAVLERTLAAVDRELPDFAAR